MAFGNPAAERRALEGTYEDTADILRPAPQREGDITRAVYAPCYQRLACALSRAGVNSRLGRERSSQSRAENRLDYDTVLFLPPEPVLQPGDRVHIHRWDGTTLALDLVGRSIRYATHQEAAARERGLI